MKQTRQIKHRGYPVRAGGTSLRPPEQLCHQDVAHSVLLLPRGKFLKPNICYFKNSKISGEQEIERNNNTRTQQDNKPYHKRKESLCGAHLIVLVGGPALSTTENGGHQTCMLHVGQVAGAGAVRRAAVACGGPGEGA